MRHPCCLDARVPEPAPPLTIEAVNALDRDAFVTHFGDVFEHSPWVAADAWEARPFADAAACTPRWSPPCGRRSASAGWR